MGNKVTFSSNFRTILSIDENINMLLSEIFEDSKKITRIHDNILISWENQVEFYLITSIYFKEGTLCIDCLQNLISK